MCHCLGLMVFSGELWRIPTWGWMLWCETVERGIKRHPVFPSVILPKEMGQRRQSGS